MKLISNILSPKLPLNKINTVISSNLNKSENLEEEYTPIINSDTVLYPAKYVGNKKLSGLFWGDILGDINDLKDLINYLNYLSNSLELKWGKIKGDITKLQDLFDTFSIENQKYTSNYIQTENVKDTLDLIVDKLYYKLPEDVKADVRVVCFRQGKALDKIYEGMIIDNILYTMNVINYANSLVTVSIDGNYLGNCNSYSNQVSKTNSFSTNIFINVNFLDSKGNHPKSFNKTFYINFEKRQFYWIGDNENIKKIIPANIFNVEIKNDDYIYLMLSSKHDNIHIYELGAVDPGGTVTVLEKTFSYKEFDNDITYYLYRSINKLTGKWTIKL